MQNEPGLNRMKNRFRTKPQPPPSPPYAFLYGYLQKREPNEPDAAAGFGRLGHRYPPSQQYPLHLLLLVIFLRTRFKILIGLVVLKNRLRRNRRRNRRFKVEVCFWGGVATAKPKRLHSGEPVRLVRKLFAMHVGLGISLVGFFQNIDRLVARRFPWMCIRIVIEKCWRWEGRRNRLDRRLGWATWFRVFEGLRKGRYDWTGVDSTGLNRSQLVLVHRFT